MGYAYSELLFPMPSAWYGLARLLDLGGNFDSYNQRPTPAEADALALYSDWRAVGQDLSIAIEAGAEDIDPKVIVEGD